jgi:CheY-like chemotaxis protein
MNQVKILVAEDNLINQKYLERLLKKLEYSFMIVGTGSEVIEVLKSEKYEILFLDISMPDMDGFEVTKIIKEKFKQEERPIIIALTANSSDEDKEKYLNVGMIDLLPKPIQIQDLKNIIEKYSN